MPLTINKHILLVLLLAFPLVLSAQIGKKKYVTRSGDTTLVVMTGSTGLRGEDAQFLFDETISEDFVQKRSRYSRLKEAAVETEQVAGVINAEQEEMNPSASSLSFRIAQKNVRYLQNDKSTNNLANRKINPNTSLDEMVYLKEKFGNKPTYFINGEEVSPEIAARVPQKEILSRELRVANTTTGNPNGEIWYIITSKMFDKLNIGDSLNGVSYANSKTETTGTGMGNTEIKIKDEIVDYSNAEDFSPSINSNTSLTPEQQAKLTDQQKEIEELKRAIEAYSKQAEPSSRPIATSQPAYSTPAKAAESRVVTRREGNRFIDTEEEVFSFKDSPQERSRQERDQQSRGKFLDGSVFGKKEEVIQVQNQAVDGFSDPNITEQTPKRSVRRIKERQRNQ